MKLLQFPEGFKKKVLEFAKKEDVEIIWCEPCYGACDIPEYEAKTLGCNEIIHLGHSKIVNTKIKVKYLEMREKIEIISLLKKNLHLIKNYKNIGLLTSVQFLDYLNDIKKCLEENEKNVFIGKSKNLYPGQILGCNIEAAEEIKNAVDCYLFIGSGKFHPLGVSIKINKPVFCLNVETGKLEDLSDITEKIKKQRIIAKSLSKDAKVFGIIVSTKIGQNNIKKAKEILKKLKESGKEAYILAMNEIKPEKIPEKIECLINTACPRIAIEDAIQFKKPIINLDELEL
ncbi:MAG: diphthamide biosynthesis enzyme Dph2 [Candidatus Aenigmarchaeota archaeon]|nr:diphthamide biosynthesis enzyme Dph2 [Candidatus Aenigmarchaeota archaeon]